MKTIQIKGKPYIPVNERLKHFRTSDQFKDWAIAEEITDINDSEILVKISIIDQEGRCRVNAHSHEYRDSSMINKTSFLENAMTSALGRALGYLGIGIDTSIATYEEVGNAVKKQDLFKRQKLTDAQVKKTLEGTREQALNVMAKFDLTPNQKQLLISKFNLNGN